jgi:alpha-1,2-mannosyltransferase
MRGRRAWWSGWAALALSVAAYGAAGLLGHQPFHEGARALGYFDLKIYRGAAQRVVAGTPLYARPIQGGLGFTYPPFTALMMAPLAWASPITDELAVTGVNLLLLVWVMRRTLLLASEGRGTAPVPVMRAWAPAAALAAGAIWLEPVSVTLGYGQLNLLITALVVGDLSRPDHARTKGLGVGLAAALKLTPLLFIPYLLLSGRRRAAGLAAAVFAASIGLAYAVLGADAMRFWGGRLFLDPARVGGTADWSDQSLRGALARLSGHGGPGAGTELLIGAIAVCGLALAVGSGRRGDEATGFSLTALTALLVSPISWTHHWALAVPALVLLGLRAHRRRSRGLWIATIALIALGCSYAPEYVGAAVHTRGLATFLSCDPYVFAAAMALVTAAVRSALAVRRPGLSRTAPPSTTRSRGSTTHANPAIR